jgi:hypothetical protein
VAEGHQDFPVARALLNSDLPLRDNQRQQAQRLSRVRQCQVREMTKCAAMCEVIGGMIGGKRRRLERERGRNQQQYRQGPYIVVVKRHKRLNYNLISALTLRDRLESTTRPLLRRAFVRWATSYTSIVYW